MSTTTSSKPRRAASSTPATTAGSTPLWRSLFPGQDRNGNPPARGRESASWRGSIVPLASARSGQRRPAVSSAASASSSPPPHGSPSTSRTRTPSPGGGMGQPDRGGAGSGAAAAADNAQDQSARLGCAGAAEVLGEPGRGLGQHGDAFGADGGRQVPQAVAVSVEADEDGRRPSPRRQLADVAAEQHRRGCVPEGRRLPDGPPPCAAGRRRPPRSVPPRRAAARTPSPAASPATRPGATARRPTRPGPAPGHRTVGRQTAVPGTGAATWLAGACSCGHSSRHRNPP